MAEYAAPSSDSITALEDEITTVKAALATAQAQLAADITTSWLVPTAANLAAVGALRQRVATDQALLASLYTQLAAAKASAGTTTTTSTPPTYGTTGLAGGHGGSIPGWSPPLKIPINGVVLGGAMVAAEDWWGMGVLDLESLLETNVTLDAIAASALDAGTAFTIAEVGGGLVAAIADLPLVAVAVAVVPMCYLVGKILIFVGRYFPNPSIFGWRPLNFVQAGLEHVGQEIVNAADGLMKPVKAIFLTPVHLFKSLFQRGANATASAHNKIGHIVRLTIPEARHDAVVTANSYTNEQIHKLGIDAINTKITTISDTLGSVHEAQKLITNEITNITAMGAVGLTAVVAVMAKTLTALKTHVDTCVVDNCDTTNKNNIHNILRDILAGITAAAEIGYVSTAIADPVGFANLQAPTFEQIDTQAVDLLNTILSL